LEVQEGPRARADQSTHEEGEGKGNSGGTGREQRNQIHFCEAIYAIEESTNADHWSEVTSRMAEVTARAKTAVIQG